MRRFIGLVVVLAALLLLLALPLVGAQVPEGIRFYPSGSNNFRLGPDSLFIRYHPPLSNLKSGLVSYWELNEESGTREDIHGPNDVTDSGSTGFTAGVNSNAVAFAATTDLSISDAAQTGLDLGQKASFSFWYRDSAFSLSQVILSKWTYATDGGFSFGPSDGGSNDIAMWIATAANDNASGCQVRWNGLNLDVNTWYHIVVVFDGTQVGDAARLNLYKNASKEVATTFSGAVPSALLANAAPWSFSLWPGLTRRISADIDEFAVWNRALTGAEITSLYNNGNGKFYATF